MVNYTKLMKAILEKVNENSKFIESERNKLNFKLNDVEFVDSIEQGIKVSGTPFLRYHESWKKVYMQQQARKVVDNVKVRRRSIRRPEENFVFAVNDMKPVFFTGRGLQAARDLQIGQEEEQGTVQVGRATRTFPVRRRRNRPVLWVSRAEDFKPLRALSTPPHGLF